MKRAVRVHVGALLARRLKRLRLFVRVALLGVAFALPVSADAPLDQYKSFDSNNRVIADNYTKLTWERPASYPAPMKLAEAQAHCTQLGSTFRVPSLKELLTIVDEEPHDEYETTQNVRRYIDRSAFPHTPAGEFWTSTPSDATHAWTVDFGTAKTASANTGTDPRYVRCVSGPL